MNEQATYFWPVYEPGKGETIIELPAGERPSGLLEGGPYTSYGPRCASREEVHQKCGLTESCCECGSLIRTTFMNAATLLARKLCFNCNFWTEIVETRPSGLVVIDGEAYEIHPDLPVGSYACAGFCGRRFDIVFDDGREVATRNLWLRGDVPAHFRDRLPDTAHFVHGEKWVDVEGTRHLVRGAV